MRGKYYLKRVVFAVLNKTPDLPVASEGVQALCDVILREIDAERDEVKARLDALLTAQEATLREQIIRQNNKESIARIEAMCLRLTDQPLEQKLMPGGGEPIPVVLICDEAYAIPTAVTILSLLLNKNSDTRYEITVLGRALSEASRTMFASLGPSVRMISCEGSKTAVYAKTHPYVSDAALLKFDIPQLLGQYDKVLYLDGDILVQGDLSSLYATDLEENFVAAIKDLLGSYYHFDTRTGVVPYFNSGVMLLNTKKMRAEKTTAKLFKNKANDRWRLLMDQDTFNVTFRDKALFLHPRYNLMYANNLESGWSMEQMGAFYGISEEEMRQTMEKPVIQHLSSQNKPWKNEFAEKYLDYMEYRILLDLLLERQNLKKKNED